MTDRDDAKRRLGRMIGAHASQFGKLSESLLMPVATLNKISKGRGEFDSAEIRRIGQALGLDMSVVNLRLSIIHSQSSRRPMRDGKVFRAFA